MSEQNIDRAVPNPTWSQEMVAQFNRLMEMTKDGSWKKLPSYRTYPEHFPEGLRKEEFQRDSRLFLRGIDGEGKGFEYAMFLNPSEKRMAAIFQIGPYLEGPLGFAHGGAIATILDSTMGMNMYYISRKVVTANLNINFKSPLALGSVVVVDSRVDKIEGRKILVSCKIQNVNGQCHAEATGLFIELQPCSPLQKGRGSSSSL